ncbi:hypothetical protein EYF80_032565 [Liparis tanakae]|uniref:Uncharacterized protein n=1 Tax=Liparis tanakae TaxID=230148 RepID=A0A4Z2GV45_9TELE|nr:hypothetical protein EYF80_032565 [Liparis tanakae]
MLVDNRARDWVKHRTSHSRDHNDSFRRFPSIEESSSRHSQVSALQSYKISSTPCAKIMTRPGSRIMSSPMCWFSQAITTTACLPGIRLATVAKPCGQFRSWAFSMRSFTMERGQPLSMSERLMTACSTASGVEIMPPQRVTLAGCMEFTHLETRSTRTSGTEARDKVHITIQILETIRNLCLLLLDDAPQVFDAVMVGDFIFGHLKPARVGRVGLQLVQPQRGRTAEPCIVTADLKFGQHVTHDAGHRPQRLVPVKQHLAPGKQHLDPGKQHLVPGKQRTPGRRISPDLICHRSACLNQLALRASAS